MFNNHGAQFSELVPKTASLNGGMNSTAWIILHLKCQNELIFALSFPLTECQEKLVRLDLRQRKVSLSKD